MPAISPMFRSIQMGSVSTVKRRAFAINSAVARARSSGLEMMLSGWFPEL
jgi:hypothetical protein